MAEHMVPGPIHGSPCFKEAVCVHTQKIYDSCRMRECMQELPVFLTRGSQEMLERAGSVKPKSAALLWVYTDVEAVPFHRGFYSVDARFIYRVTVDAYCGVGRPYELVGMAAYQKRVVLYGGEGSVRIFGSQYLPEAADLQNPERTNLPVATVEVVEPILLSGRIVEQCGECPMGQVPDAVLRCFDDDLQQCVTGKRLYVSIGQFGIIRIQRDSQLLMPSYDFCVPEKECTCQENEDPCSTFAGISFPAGEFFPGSAGCGCNP